jgi:hypothetical protein
MIEKRGLNISVRRFNYIYLVFNTNNIFIYFFILGIKDLLVKYYVVIKFIIMDMMGDIFLNLTVEDFILCM